MDSLSRLAKYFDALVRKAVEDLLCMRTMPYVVTSCNAIAQTVSLRSLDASMPDLTDVSLRSPGLVMNLPPGTAVSVAVDVGGVPYVQSYASGGVPPLVPSSGSGVQNNIDAGYVVVIQNAITFLMLQPLYFPAGVAGQTAAATALATAIGAGNVAFLLHMPGGRVLPNGWTVP